MELTELTAYAWEKYHIREEHRWADLPGFSVLAAPDTGKWAALLMRQWDFDTGTEIQVCDIRCGRQVLSEAHGSYLSSPFRMKGKKWVGVSFDDRTEPDVIFRLFDRAVRPDGEGSCIIILQDAPAKDEAGYRDTPLPPAGTRKAAGDRPSPSAQISPGTQPSDTARISSGAQPSNAALISSCARPSPALRISPDMRPSSEAYPAYTDTALPEIPEKLRRMQRLYEYGDGSFTEKCRNFYRQGRFMEDYEDDAPWDGIYRRYFPTYHDLNLRQLRGYFTWRTHVRKGEFSPISASMAYLYLYELLNGIGTRSPEDTIEKMKAFEAGFLDGSMETSGRKSLEAERDGMRRNLRRWMLDYAVIHNISLTLAQSCADPVLLEGDAALSVLRDPETAEDEALFSALCLLSGKKTEQSPVVKKFGERGKRLFAEVWRFACRAWSGEGRDLFTACFGERKDFSWRPLANAVYWEEQAHPDADYALDACRTYHCRGGIWQEKRYDRLYFDRKRLQGLLHETDRQLRRYLKTGSYLREDPEEKWASSYAEAVINADRQEELEAARPRITIDLSRLDQIRQDAVRTRDSLLVEEDADRPDEAAPAPGYPAAPEPDRPDRKPPGEKAPVPAAFSAPSAGPEYPPAGLEHPPAGPEHPPAGPEHPSAGLEHPPAGLDPLHAQLLLELLSGKPVEETMKARRLMPSIVADTINEALFEEIGDNVLECDGSSVALVEDYREDILQLLQPSADKDR